jgi:hypothetical protein
VPQPHKLPRRGRCRFHNSTPTPPSTAGLRWHRGPPRRRHAGGTHRRRKARRELLTCFQDLSSLHLQEAWGVDAAGSAMVGERMHAGTSPASSARGSQPSAPPHPGQPEGGRHRTPLAAPITSKTPRAHETCSRGSGGAFGRVRAPEPAGTAPSKALAENPTPAESRRPGLATTQTGSCQPTVHPPMATPTPRLSQTHCFTTTRSRCRGAGERSAAGRLRAGRPKRGERAPTSAIGSPGFRTLRFHSCCQGGADPIGPVGMVPFALLRGGGCLPHRQAACGLAPDTRRCCCISYVC